MIRLFIALVLAVVFLILSVPAWGIMWIIKKFNPTGVEKAYFVIVSAAFRMVYRVCGVKLKVEGLENIPTDQGVVFVGNHSSIFDIVVFWGAMKKPVAFVAKSTIKKVPLLSTWMKLNHCVFLNRENPREAIKAITDAADNVKNNWNMFIFPEGTRSKDGNIAEFKEGSLKIASRAAAPVIPVAFTGTRAVFEKRKLFTLFCPVTIKIGKPQLIAELPEDVKKYPGTYFKNQVESMLS